jgi:hypothetical protein
MCWDGCSSINVDAPRAERSSFRDAPWQNGALDLPTGASSMTSARPLWYWCLLGAVTMSLGWGLRGSIGGELLGAMIPGGYVLCAWRLRDQLAGASEPAARQSLAAALLAAAFAIGGAIVAGHYLPFRFDYTIAGAVLASVALSAFRYLLPRPAWDQRQ